MFRMAYFCKAYSKKSLIWRIVLPLFFSIPAWSTPTIVEHAVHPVIAQSQSQASCLKKEEIGPLVKQYLLAHPEVLVEAYTVLQKKEEAKVQEKALSVAQAHQKLIFADPLSPAIGSAQGPIEVVEFFDYQCGHCKVLSAVLQTLLKKDRQIKLIFKELPIFGENSSYAAKAALAAGAQHKYLALHEALFAEHTALRPESILMLAKKTGIFIPRLKKDMQSLWVKKAIARNIHLAETLALQGTPALFIRNVANGKIVFVQGALPEHELIEKIAALTAD